MYHGKHMSWALFVGLIGLINIWSNRVVVIVDVRTLKEWRAGHVDGAIHLPLTTLEHTSTLPYPFSRHRNAIVYCNSGRRARQAKKMLEKLGAEHIEVRKLSDLK